MLCFYYFCSGVDWISYRRIIQLYLPTLICLWTGVKREREREREREIFLKKKKNSELWALLSAPNAKITLFFTVISLEFQITKVAKKAQMELIPNRRTAPPPAPHYTKPSRKPTLIGVGVRNGKIAAQGIGAKMSSEPHRTTPCTPLTWVKSK